MVCSVYVNDWHKHHERPVELTIAQLEAYICSLKVPSANETPLGIQGS